MGGARREDGARAPAATVRTGAPGRTLTVSRAKTLAHRAFDDAMDALGASNRALGDHLGIDEAVVRGMRNGKRAITATRILRLPPALRAEYLARLAAAADAPPCAPTREGRALAVLAAAGAVSHELAGALADGTVTPEEAERAMPVIAALRRTLDALAMPMGDA